MSNIIKVNTLQRRRFVYTYKESFLFTIEKNATAEQIDSFSGLCGLFDLFCPADVFAEFSWPLDGARAAGRKGSALLAVRSLHERAPENSARPRGHLRAEGNGASHFSFESCNLRCLGGLLALWPPALRSDGAVGPALEVAVPRPCRPDWVVLRAVFLYDLPCAQDEALARAALSAGGRNVPALAHRLIDRWHFCVWKSAIKINIYIPTSPALASTTSSK